MRLVVLAYHHITRSESAVESRLYMDASRFEQQLHYLSSLGLPVVSSPDQLKNGLSKCQTAIMLTFDDGYENFYSLAYPLLKKYRLSSVLFVPTAKIGLRLFEADYSGFQNYASIHQLQDMLDSGFVNLQPHGHSHIPLGDFPAFIQHEDIKLSIEFLSKNFGLSSQFFCLPYGSYSSETFEILRKFNVRCIFTTNFGDNQLSSLSGHAPIAINRFAFKSSTSIDAFKIALELPEIS